jgi:MFS family permease
LIESRQAEPLLRLTLFKIRVITFSLFAAFFQGLGGFAVLFLIMMYLQGVRGLSPLDSSLLLVPGYLVGGIAGPFGGRLADRYGSVLPATVGLGLQAVAILVYAQIGVSTSLVLIIVASVLNGIGSGGFFPANNSAVMKGAPPGEYGIASGMLRTFANVGMVMSFAVALLMASTRIPRGLAFAIFVGSTHLHTAQLTSFVDGVHTALYLAIGSMVLAALGSVVRGSSQNPRVASSVNTATEA